MSWEKMGGGEWWYGDFRQWSNWLYLRDGALISHATLLSDNTWGGWSLMLSNWIFSVSRDPWWVLVAKRELLGNDWNPVWNASGIISQQFSLILNT